LWEGKSTAEIARDPEWRDVYERLVGPLDLMNEHELRAERATHVRNAELRRDRLTTWLNDERIRDWTARLDSQSGTNGEIPTFFALIAARDEACMDT